MKKLILFFIFIFSQSVSAEICPEILRDLPNLAKYVHPADAFRDEGGLHFDPQNLRGSISKILNHPNGNKFRLFFEEQIRGYDGLAHLEQRASKTLRLLLATYRAYAYNSEELVSLEYQSSKGFFERVDAYEPSWSEFWSLFCILDLKNYFDKKKQAYDQNTRLPKNYGEQNPRVVFDPSVLDLRTSNYPGGPDALERDLKEKFGSFTSLWLPMNTLLFGTQIARRMHGTYPAAFGFRESFGKEDRMEFERISAFFSDLLKDTPSAYTGRRANVFSAKITEAMQEKANYLFISNDTLFNAFLNIPRAEQSDFEMNSILSEPFILPNGKARTIRIYLTDHLTRKNFQIEIISVQNLNN
ncbi:MAG: hypothetical protein J0L93_07890 [Deltaproteobacteria bacterium]|nr:hypothetical protein [Deltaproteobacteria bacterium]